jgi:F0F1-type ATP synthase alpha subunit
MGLNEKTFKDIGIVEAIGSGIVSLNVANGEMIRFCISEKGLVLNLEKNKISDEKIKPGQVDGN